MTLTHFLNDFIITCIIIIVYTFLEPLHYIVFITTLFNDNYIILFLGSKRGRFIGINSIVLT